MRNFFTEQSNYDKQPFVAVQGYGDTCCQAGWKDIADQLRNRIPLSKEKHVLVVDCYTGVDGQRILSELTKALSPDYTVHASELMKAGDAIDQMVYPDVTDDEVFGYLTRLHLIDFFDPFKLAEAKEKIEKMSSGLVLVLGVGASLIAAADTLIYADMPRWEGQLRFRRAEADNLGVSNRGFKASLQYKRAFFVDWRVCDRHKKKLMNHWDYVLDTVNNDFPKMVTGEAFRAGLRQAAERPIRVVPFFDPGPWGGQWMKEVCDLDRSSANFAWCFDCVPEENSLLLRFGNTEIETPSINLVFFEPQKLLGDAVHGRFGDEFPIRFDFLDTMGGGNLSLQVHPSTEYIQEHFGMRYTQDESYYILDVGDDAFVYLGLKDDVDPESMMDELYQSTSSGAFDAEKHVAKWSIKKHDHILIPGGLIHCSGANSMVLEISATPYIFTFKLWDWGRLGLDGKPRPINIGHGREVINWSQTAKEVPGKLINAVVKVDEGDGWIEERTGLHEREFIETRRHWFTKPVSHHTNGTVNVLNLIDGREAIVESPSNSFEPFIVHYAETFIIPAAVGDYTIRPYGESEGKNCVTIKAYVRTQS